MFDHGQPPASGAETDERLRTLGLLVQRVAHDLNNMLTPVSASASILKSHFPTDSRERRVLHRIENCAIRATDFVRKLDDYAQENLGKPIDVDLNELVLDTESVIKLILPERAKLSLRLADDGPVVKVVPSIVQRALLLVATNSCEAVAENELGLVDIATGVARPDKDGLDYALFDNEAFAEGAYIEIRDNGPEIDLDLHEITNRLFLTTKDYPRGLGLPAACEVARNHHGVLKLGTGAGRGMRVRLYFPTGRYLG